MRTCVTCGRELHPERAEKYSYCTARECQERNAKGLTVLAVGVNKAADLYEVVDERTRGKVASGRYVEKLVTGSETVPDADKAKDKANDKANDKGRAKGKDEVRRAPSGRAGPAKRPSALPAPRPAGKAPRPRWTESQRTLALLYSEQGMRPDQIAKRLGLTPSVVIEIILGARSRPAP